MNKREIQTLTTLLRGAGLLKEKSAATPGDFVVQNLSLRELQIFVAIASGTPPAQAAEVLGIAVKSFSTYRARVLEKLNLKANAELAVLAFELGLVPSVLKRLQERPAEK